MIAIRAARVRLSESILLAFLSVLLSQIARGTTGQQARRLLASRLTGHAPVADAFLHRARRRPVVDRRPLGDAGV